MKIVLKKKFNSIIQKQILLLYDLLNLPMGQITDIVEKYNNGEEINISINQLKNHLNIEDTTDRLKSLFDVSKLV